MCFPGQGPARLVGVVGFEPTTLTPQRSSHLNDYRYLQTSHTARNREGPQIPASPLLCKVNLLLVR